ncbi:spondin-2 [Lingula anatina]|uniref:Spondin-2 n=1 Tax=Lingula anatina TaxID=7574 RepID=A0A1S3JZH1_LINAN|nr:spondin-2 [Lingula anatina]|eukprot:XP_013415677.1 spondin-2 [Lingula anatina]
MQAVAAIAVFLCISSFTVFAKPTPGKTPEEKCRAKGVAVYSVTFQAKWNKKLFPKMFPLYRPPAQWSKLIGRSHDSKYSLWTQGKYASKAVKEFAKTGRTMQFDQEAQGFNGIFDVFNGPRIQKGHGISVTKFYADPMHPKVSAMAKLIPSPDWFVGVDSINLCQNGEWITDVKVDLDPMDAGVDRGFTFTSPDWPENEKIFRITSKYPNHPANPFFYPRLAKLPHIGHLIFKRVRVYDDGEVAKDAMDEDNAGGNVDDSVDYYDDDVEDEEHEDESHGNDLDAMDADKSQFTPLDCIVSDWGAWSGCSKTCGFGKRTRHRVVVQERQNGGHTCPILKEEETCGSMRTCKWNHFRFKGFGL